MTEIGARYSLSFGMRCPRGGGTRNANALHQKMRLAAATKKLWRSHLDLVEEKWGDAPTAVWNDPRMKAKVVSWRNARKETPRAADNGVVVLSALLRWVGLNGHGVGINAAAEILRLYKGGNRQEIIWLPDDIDRFVAAPETIGRPWIADALRLSLTGLRVADLATLTFDQVGEAAIEKVALKRTGGKRRRVTIPVTTTLVALLRELRSRQRQTNVNAVLVNSYGRPWTPSGLTGSFNRIRDAAKIVHVDEEGAERAKHLHDVRGTFCTFLLVECGLTDEEAADIMGWSRDRVNGIRRVYVDDSARVVALAQRIAANQQAKHAAR